MIWFQVILGAAAIGVLWYMFAQGKNSLEDVFKDIQEKATGQDGPNDINALDQPLSYMTLADRKKSRGLRLNKAQYRGLRTLNPRTFQTTDAIVWYDPSRPLERSAGMKLTGYFECSRIVGHPVAISFLCWAIQWLDLNNKLPGGERRIRHSGCYAQASDPDYWHPWGCALDLDIRLQQQYIYLAGKELKLNIQWCDERNRYWIGGPGSPDGGQIHGTCKPGHDTHLHLEISPTFDSWGLVNMINFQETDNLTAHI